MLDTRIGVTAVKIEGLALADQPGAPEADLIADLTVYYGGEDAATATAVRVEQFKYSVSASPPEWTFGKLQKTKSGKPGILPRFVKAWKEAADKGWASKVKLVLISNAPLASEVQKALADISSGDATTTAARKLAKAAGLGATEASNFFQRVQLSCGEGGRLVQEITLLGRMQQHFRANPDSAMDKLLEFVRRMAGPDGERVGSVNRAMLLLKLGTSGRNIFPCPALFSPPRQVIQTRYPAKLANALQTHRRVLVHASAGMGKSTTLQSLEGFLPEGSAVILYDCYGGGASGVDRTIRSRAQDFITQVTNELACRGLAPLMLRGQDDPEYRLRDFQDVLARASSEVASRGGLLVIAADAVDDAYDARKGETWFLPDLGRIEWPAAARLIISSRSHRLNDLPQQFATWRFEIHGFNLAQSSEHLRQFWPKASERECREFHLRTGGKDAGESAAPRVQDYAIKSPGTTSAAMAVANAKGGWGKLMEILLGDFQKHFDNTTGLQAVAAVSLLVPGASLRHFGWLWTLPESAARTRLDALGPGLSFAGEVVQFGDKDFEEHFRHAVDIDALPQARTAIARALHPRRKDDTYSANHIAGFLSDAELHEDLIALALNEPEPPETLYPDPRERSAVAVKRVDLALAAAAGLGKWEDVTELGIVRVEVGRVRVGLLNLFANAPCIAARFLGHGAVRETILKSEDRWDYPKNAWNYALVLATCGQADAAKDCLKKGYDALRVVGSDQRFRLHSEDIVAYIQTAYIFGGMKSCLQAFGHWKHRVWNGIVSKLRWKLAENMNVSQREELLNNHSIPHRFRVQFAASLWMQSGYFFRQSLGPLLTWLLSRPPGKVGSIKQYQGRDDAQTDIIAVCEAAVAAGYSLPRVCKVVRRHLPEMPNWPARQWHELTAGRWGAALRSRALLALGSGDELNATKLKDERLKSRPDAREGWDHYADRAFSTAVDVTSDGAAMLKLRTVAEHRNLVKPRIERLRNEWERKRREYDDLQGAQLGLVAWLLALRRVEGFDAPWLAELLECGKELQTEGAEALQWLERLTGVAGEFCLIEGYTSEAHHFLRACIREAEQASSGLYSKRELLLAVAGAAQDEVVKREAWDAAVKIAGSCDREDYESFVDLLALAESAGAIQPSTAPTLAAEVVSWAERFRQVTEGEGYPEDRVFSAITSLHFPTALATLARWMDGARSDASPGIQSIIETAVSLKVIPAANGYGLLHMAMPQFTDSRLLCRLLECSARDTEEARVIRNRMLQSIVDFVQRDMPYLSRAKAAKTLIEFADRLGLGSLACILRLRKLHEFTTDLQIGSAGSRDERPRTSVQPEAKPTPPTDVSRLSQWISAHANHLDTEAISVLKSWMAALPASSHAELIKAICSAGNRKYDRGTLLNLLDELRGRIPASTFRQCSTAIISLAAESLGEVGTQHYKPQLEAVIGIHDLAGMTEHQFLAALITARVKADEYWIPTVIISARSVRYGDTEQIRNRLVQRLQWAAARWFPENMAPPNVSTAKVPHDNEDAQAGFYWACFTHPDKQVRCRALYAVLETTRVSTDCRGLVERLVAFVTSTDTGCFRDPGQGPCFWISGRLFLWRLLRRIAHDRPDLLAPHVNLLATAALDKTLPHALIRELARGTLLALAAGGFQLPEDIHARIVALNRPAAATEERIISASPPGHDHRYDFRGSRFGFSDLDTIPKWFGDVAGIFGMLTHEVVERADTWACDHWGLVRNETWRDEPRRAHMVGDNYGRWSNSHGQEPELENLSLYAPYHAMFCVAGQLIDEGTLTAKPSKWDKNQCRFRDWLEHWHGHDDAVTWGRDLICPPPLSSLAWGILPTKAEARQPLEMSDFDTPLRLSEWENDWLVVQGSEGGWNFEVGHHSQIMPFLVDDDYAWAFAAAAQTRRWPNQRYFPQESRGLSDDFQEGVTAPFSWQTLVVANSDDRRWLEHDPFLQKNDYSLPRPSDHVANLLKANRAELARWRAAGHGDFLIGQQWGFQEKDHRGRAERGHGGELCWFRASTLLAILRAERKAAVIMVSIRRDEKEEHHHTKGKDWHPERDCALYYILRADTTLATLAGTRLLGEPVAGQPWTGCR